MIDGTRNADLRVEFSTLQLFLAHWRGSLIGIAFTTVASMVVWSEYLDWPGRAAWCVLLLANYAMQALVCLRLERASSMEDARKLWMPWLLVSIIISGCLWGLLPWMLADSPPPVSLQAALFNGMLVFCIANAPATTRMFLSAWTSAATMTCGALLAQPDGLLVGIAFVAVFTVILIYGLRLQSAIRTSLRERHRAADLAEALACQQQRLLDIEHERTLLLERERLMRDIHDGLGSVLVSSLAAVERGALTPDEMAVALRECVDDLRIVIDSLGPNNNDLVGLLAALRFHLGRRLEKAGVQLEWHVDELPPLPWMGASESLQLMRAIQEVLSNVIKHARARHVSITARESDGGVEVIIQDDGCGFDRGLSTVGRGLRSLKKRADMLRGRLTLTSQPGAGTEVRLWLPLDADVQTEADSSPGLAGC